MLVIDGPLRLYGFDLLGKGRSYAFTSTNAKDWQATSEVQLDMFKGLESERVKDPALVELEIG